MGFQFPYLNVRNNIVTSEIGRLPLQNKKTIALAFSSYEVKFLLLLYKF